MVTRVPTPYEIVHGVNVTSSFLELTVLEGVKAAMLTMLGMYLCLGRAVRVIQHLAQEGVLAKRSSESALGPSSNESGIHLRYLDDH